MAKECWAKFGSIAFAIALCLVIFPVHRYQMSQRHPNYVWTIVQYLIYMYGTFTASLAHSLFLYYYRDVRANVPFKLIGPLEKLVRDMINVGLAPLLLHQIVDQFPSLTKPYAWWLPGGWTFLLALMWFTITYRVWAHVLHVAYEFDTMVDMIVGSGMQVAVYAVAGSKNYYVMMVLILLYGCFSFSSHLLYSRWSARVVDFAEVDLEEGSVLPSSFP